MEMAEVDFRVYLRIRKFEYLYFTSGEVNKNGISRLYLLYAVNVYE